jgi:hypothetical protein
VFTARYAPSPYIKQTRFVFKGLRDFRFCGLCMDITTFSCVGTPCSLLEMYDILEESSTSVFRARELNLLLCVWGGKFLKALISCCQTTLFYMPEGSNLHSL